MDARGQVVIPKDMRNELGISSGCGFWMFSIEKEGLLLKKIETPDFDDSNVDSIKKNAKKINVDVKNVDKASQYYKKGKGGRLDVV
jgi:bifunctional DNA-binding transcriptional regulator/antitoxin component of YhaV-PrlF toxin-antitoxin module